MTLVTQGQAPGALIVFSVAMVILCVAIYLLGTLMMWYQQHRMLARILIIGLIISAIATYLAAHSK